MKRDFLFHISYFIYSDLKLFWMALKFIYFQHCVRESPPPRLNCEINYFQSVCLDCMEGLVNENNHEPSKFHLIQYCDDSLTFKSKLFMSMSCIKCLESFKEWKQFLLCFFKPGNNCRGILHLSLVVNRWNLVVLDILYIFYFWLFSFKKYFIVNTIWQGPYFKFWEN